MEFQFCIIEFSNISLRPLWIGSEVSIKTVQTGYSPSEINEDSAVMQNDLINYFLLSNLLLIFGLMDTENDAYDIAYYVARFFSGTPASHQELSNT
jgi:hypothetical protein